MENKYLAHHGVKGMKWGVRHERAKARRAQKRYARKALNDAKSNEYNEHTYVDWDGVRGGKSAANEKKVRQLYESIGKEYLAAHKEIMALDPSSTTAKKYKNIYYKHNAEALKKLWGDSVLV